MKPNKLLSAQAIRKLRSVQRHILAEPLRVYMEEWKTSSQPITGKTPKCGTVACIAGWIDLLYSDPAQAKLNTGVPCRAGTILGIGPLRYETDTFSVINTPASRLFLGNHWPSELKRSLYKAKPGTKAYATIVSRRIERFIETDGEE